jgi:hypothetical protein
MGPKHLQAYKASIKIDDIPFKFERFFHNVLIRVYISSATSVYLFWRICFEIGVNADKLFGRVAKYFFFQTNVMMEIKCSTQILSATTATKRGYL